MFSAISIVVLLRSSGGIYIHGPVLLIASLLCIPFAQYLIGLIDHFGVAWIATSYLLGFLLSLLVGSRWEKSAPGQLVDALCLAVGIAAVISVGLQLHQWLLIERLDIWSMGNGYGRPFANFGQPNQLGTFLIWGLLAIIWGLERKYIRGTIAVLLAIYLLFGIALTGSRTAWLGMIIILAAIWFWRQFWLHRKMHLAITVLALYFVVCVASLKWLGHLLHLHDSSLDTTGVARLTGELRPLAWKIFIDAVSHRPWLGYGWEQIAHAQLEVAVNHSALPLVFSRAHNIFLDFLLWCGVPVGLTVSGLLAWWFWKSFRAVNSAENVVLLLLLVVMVNHAMLEFPLHYAYFLLPAGLIIGAMETRLAAPLLRLGGRWIGVVIWLIATGMLSVTIRDYMRVETSFQALRFEWANIKITEPKEAPDVMVLSQLRDLIKFSRFEPREGMSDADLEWMRGVAKLYPSAGTIHKLAAALAWNKHPEEAQLWLSRMCRITPVSHCKAIARAWASQARDDPKIRAVPWPNTPFE